MPLTLATAPAAEPVTLTETKAHLRRDDTADDTLITALITAARQHIDGRDGWLGRALVTQTWDLTIDGGFPDEIAIPLPPLQSVTSVTYVDSNGATQTLAADQYRVLTDRTPGVIAPAHDVTWPTTRDQKGAVTVRFVAGYGLAADVPSTVKAALLLHIGTLYENREAATDKEPYAVPFAYDALLAPLKVWSFA